MTIYVCVWVLSLRTIEHRELGPIHRRSHSIHSHILDNRSDAYTISAAWMRAFEWCKYVNFTQISQTRTQRKTNVCVSVCTCLCLCGCVAANAVQAGRVVCGLDAHPLKGENGSSQQYVPAYTAPNTHLLYVCSAPRSMLAQPRVCVCVCVFTT